MINLEPSQNLEKGDNSFTIDGVTYTVFADSEVRHSQPVNDLLIIALPLIDEKNGVEMERLLRKALEFEPDQADLAFFLALALDLQNRRKEATAILQKLVKQHPDFLLARIELAAMALKKGLRNMAVRGLSPFRRAESCEVVSFNLCAESKLSC